MTGNLIVHEQTRGRMREVEVNGEKTDVDDYRETIMRPAHPNFAQVGYEMRGNGRVRAIFTYVQYPPTGAGYQPEGS